MVKKLTNDEFIEKSKLIHDDKYDYSLVDYVNSKTKVKIICKKCSNIFEQTPNNHSRGQGCPKCYSKNLTNDERIENFNKVHNYEYDYSLTNFIRSNLKVKIICKKCNSVFEQRPNDHLNGQGCPKCNAKLKLTEEEIVKKANEVHNNKYDYSLFLKYSLNNDYKTQKTKIDIICPIHGEFKQQINNHLNGKGCKECAKNTKKTNNKFEKESNIIHNNRWDYSLVDYINARTNVKIICKEHGIFEVSPNNHLSKKSGCPDCNESKGELYISEILNKYNIKYEKQYKLFHEKYAPISPLKADFYLPDKNIIIEYNGIQHYKPFKHFGGKEGLKENKERDNRKKLICIDYKIKLIKIHYKYNTYKKIEEKLKNILK